MLDPPLGLGKKADGEVEIPRVDRLFKLFHLPIPDHNGEIHFHETLHLLALDGIPTLTYVLIYFSVLGLAIFLFVVLMDPFDSIEAHV